MEQIFGDRWKVGGRLGAGVSGDLFLVEDLTGEHSGPCVLKSASNASGGRRVAREIVALGRLCHPGIVPMLDHAPIKKPCAPPYLVLPLASGGALGDPARLRAFKNKPRKIVAVALQIATALVVVHEAEIVHRDVSLQNILCHGPQGEVWLADFGLCLFRLDHRAGEVIETAKPRAFAQDVYGLGKVIEALKEGCVCQETAPLDRLLATMICPLPARLQSMRQVAAALAAI